MAGGKHNTGLRCTEAEAAAVRSRVLSRRPGPEAPGEDEALRELLRGRGVYDDPGPLCSAAPYRATLVSLPASVDDAPEVAVELADWCASYLDGDLERMRRHCDDGLAEKLEEKKAFKPCWGPALGSGRSHVASW